MKNVAQPIGQPDKVFFRFAPENFAGYLNR